MDKPYKIFGRHLIEGATIDQFLQAMDHEFVTHGALMPDAHLGYTMPIGGVIAARGHVVPSWVGYDIGCGVCAIRTTFTRSLVEEKQDEIYTNILQNVPVGFNHHKDSIFWDHGDVNPTSWFNTMFRDAVGGKQLGTLGGGNHFIEIDYDAHDNIWIVIHSGSRGIGHKTATNYMKLAHPENKAKEGTYAFEIDSKNGSDYIRDMNACLQFALDNRKEIGHMVMHSIRQAGIPGIPASDLKITGPDFINRNHNHVEVDLDGLWVHRKGATHSEKEMLGIIPGSMLTGSYIVVGAGNPDSLCSSSHGAGRILGRKQAKRQLKTKDFEIIMRGIKANVSDSTLDESPMAYKDIDLVMEAQEENCTVVHHLKPIINVKG